MESLSLALPLSARSGLLAEAAHPSALTFVHTELLAHLHEHTRASGGWVLLPKESPISQALCLANSYSLDRGSERRPKRQLITQAYPRCSSHLATPFADCTPQHDTYASRVISSSAVYLAMLTGIERFIVFPEVLLVEVTLVIYPGAIYFKKIN